jgi:phosphoglycolate phosphatase
MQDRHLILDWNGTLIDDLDAAIQGVNLVLTGQSLAPINRDVYRHHFGFPIQDFYGRLGIDFGRISFADLGRQYLAHFNQAIRHCQVFPGTFELIAAARQQGWSVSVLSASEKTTLESNLRDAGLLGHLDHVFGLEDANAKGKLDLALQLDLQLGSPGARALMVGDTDHDVEIAHALGWRAHSVSHGHQSLDRLTGIHSDVSTSLQDVVTAILLAQQHRDMTNA